MARDRVSDAFNLITMFGAIRTIAVNWPRLIALITGGIIMIDVSCITIPSEYLVAIVLSVLVMGVLFGVWVSLWLHEKAADYKLKEGKIASTKDLEFDNRYIVGSFVATVVAMIIAAYATPVIAANFFIGGEVWTHVGIALVLTPILVAFLVCLFQMGIRLFIVKFKEYRYTVRETIDGVLTPEEAKIINEYLIAHGKKPRF